MATTTKYRTCEFEPCHNLFVHRSRAGGKFKRYCSTSCGASTPRKEYTCSREDCGKVFTDRVTVPRKYCSQSCAAVVANRENPKRRPQGYCRDCNVPIRSNERYCTECRPSWRARALSVKIDAWTSGDRDIASYKTGALAEWARTHLLTLAEYKCTECGWDKPNPITGKPILTVDHVDGNWRNNSFDNLKVLCYNCHTLTETFGSLNVGSLSGARPYGESRRR